jgi:hypothetical protein
MVKIISVLMVIVVGILVYASRQPNEFKISRSISINAPPDVIYPYVNDTRKSAEWSPWLKKDPKAKVTYEGPSEGTQAKLIWDGSREIGAGSITLTASRYNEYVRERLDFIKPVTSMAEAEFILTPEGDHTTLTWNMFGQKVFMQKVFCMFMNMDKKIGGTFEEGLADLKSKVEKK